MSGEKSRFSHFTFLLHLAFTALFFDSDVILCGGPVSLVLTILSHRSLRLQVQSSDCTESGDPDLDPAWSGDFRELNSRAKPILSKWSTSMDAHRFPLLKRKGEVPGMLRMWAGTRAMLSAMDLV